MRAIKLDCTRGPRCVLQGLDLELQPGELLGVLGANGAGSVQLAGTPLDQWAAAALARRRAVLPQSPSLAFDLGVDEVVRMGAYPFPELAPARLAALAGQALALTGAQALAGRRHGSLSGGEQQRVQFARVVVQLLACRAADEYRALLLDEPTASLDPRHQIALLRAVRSLARAHGVAALVVLHDVNLAAARCDRILLLGDGRALALGTPRQVLTAAHLQAAYGLAVHILDHPRRPAQPWVLFDRADA